MLQATTNNILMSLYYGDDYFSNRLDMNAHLMDFLTALYITDAVT